jgi:pectin methylesterase-like acyl-CoA thioesterase
MGVASTIDHIEGARITLTRRAFVDGNVAIFYLPQHALAYDQTYHVTIDPGVITSPASFSVSGNKTWRFRTGARPAGSATLTVDLTGGAEYCSVQGAFDSIPTNNSAATTVTINDGTYHEIVNVSRKNNLTVRGQSRKGTVLADTSNQLQNPNFRGVANADNLSGLTIANLTLHNLTPLGGSQAEALTLRLCTHCIVRDADILSYQDTFSAWGTVYVDNAYIEGSVDFIWGGASTYIKDSHIHVVSRGYTAWARNGPDAYGIVFVDSTFTAGPGVYLHWLARTSADFPYSNVAYIDSTMGDFFTPQGWHVKEGTPTDNLRFWEYRSRDLRGNLIDVSKRAPFSRQLTHAEAAKLRNPATVLGGWVPDAAAAGAPP